MHQIVRELRDTTGPLWNELLRAEFREGDLADFRERLARSDVESIDAFLESKREETINIGKAAIALTILRAEAACRQEDNLVGNPPEDHWLGYVWSRMRESTTPNTFYTRNAVSFLTFNYDRTVESYFAIVLQNHFGLTEQQAQRIVEGIPIIHLHGQLTERQFGQYTSQLSGEAVRALADGIRVIHGPFKGSEQFTDAQTYLRRAEVQCLLGFGYHPENIERLGLNECYPKDKPAWLFGSAYKMRAADLRRRTAKIDRQLKLIETGAKSKEFLMQHVELI